MEEWQDRGLRPPRGAKSNNLRRSSGFAVRLRILPLDTRDLICPNVHTKARTRSLVSNRLSMDEVGPSPMEIGAQWSGYKGKGLGHFAQVPGERQQEGARHEL